MSAASRWGRSVIVSGSTILIFQGSAQERRPSCWPKVCGVVIEVGTRGREARPPGGRTRVRRSQVRVRRRPIQAVKARLSIGDSPARCGFRGTGHFLRHARGRCRRNGSKHRGRRPASLRELAKSPMATPRWVPRLVLDAAHLEQLRESLHEYAAERAAHRSACHRGAHSADGRCLDALEGCFAEPCANAGVSHGRRHGLFLSIRPTPIEVPVLKSRNRVRRDLAVWSGASPMRFAPRVVPHALSRNLSWL